MLISQIKNKNGGISVVARRGAVAGVVQEADSFPGLAEAAVESGTSLVAAPKTTGAVKVKVL